MSAGRTFDFNAGQEISCRVRYTPSPIDLGKEEEKYYPWPRLLSVTAKIESGRLVASRYDEHVLALVDEVAAPVAEIDPIKIRRALRARLPAVPIFIFSAIGLYLALRYLAPWLLSLVLLIITSLGLFISVSLFFLLRIFGGAWGKMAHFWSRVMWTEFVIHTRNEEFSLCVSPRREAEMLKFLREVGLPVAKSSAARDDW